MNIEAGARVLAEFFNRKYEGLHNGYLDKQYKIIHYSMQGGINLQGHKEDVKLMVAEIIKAVFELDKLPEKEDSNG